MSKKSVEIVKAESKRKVGLSESIMITEISDSILESEKEPALFELAFKIYYSESDYAIATVWTYLRPKSNDL